MLARGTRYAAILGGGAGFAPESIAIFNAFTTPPTAARKQLINTMVRSLKSSGVWTLLDVLYVFAAADSQAALINWKNPGTFNATAVNSPTFNADRGFTFNGTSNYLSAGYNPTSAAGNWTVNAAHLAVRSLTVGTGRAVGELAGAAVQGTRINLAGTSMQGALNAADSDIGGFTVGDTIGHFVITRTSASGGSGYENGTSVGTDNGATNPILADGVMAIGGDPGSGVFGSHQLASASAGGSLDATKAAALYAAELAYMQAVGAV